MRFNVMAASTLIGLLVVAGCAQPPTQAVDAARSAIDEAKKAHADQYAPDAWNAALQAKDRLDAELDAQNNRFVLVRSYGQSTTLANAALTTANEAKNAAETGMQKAKDDATAKMADARAALDALQRAVATAPRGKGTEADLTSLKSDAGSVESTLKDMQAAFDAGNYLDASAKADAALATCHNLEAEIQKASAARHSAHRT